MIPKTKFGDCVECGAKDTNCIKVGKSLYCVECRTIANKKQQIQKANLKSRVRSLGYGDKSMSERQMLTNDLDDIFSKYIRTREASKEGYISCFTCDKSFHWTKIQCGHYIKRAETLLRWDARNARPQCVNCNCILNGNMEEYTKRLELEYPGITSQLKEESKEVNKYSREYLKQLTIAIREKLRISKLKID